MASPDVSVVIATFNRPDLLRRLLDHLSKQTLAPSRFEVIAVDDGSREDVREKFADYKSPFALRVERQANAGPAKARQRGAELARAKTLVFVDDDMQVGADFLERHLARHTDDKSVVIGRLRPDANLQSMPLFERFYARILAKMSDDFASGREEVRGHHLYTGNVSLPRALLLGAGGFDAEFRALEDEELGIRLEKAGARFVFADDAPSIHGSDWTSMAKWMERAYRDGIYQTKLARKHPDVPESSPWRHIPNINPLSRPFLALSLAAPGPAALIGKAAIQTATALDKIGLEPVAIAGATLVYGIQYYRGVRQETGGALDAAREYREFRRGVALLQKGARGDGTAFRDLMSAIREDHRMVHFYADKYDDRVDGQSPAPGGLTLASDAVKKIGFQLMIAYRVMRYFRQSGLVLGAQFMSRTIRHAFASDVHWDAEIAPGVVVVHGFGLAISYAARVRHGCILFQNVTLGYGPDRETKQGGAPLLEERVHVGIGATLYGPITVGEGTKIMAGCVVSSSVPPRSIVEAPTPHVGARRGAPIRV